MYYVMEILGQKEMKSMFSGFVSPTLQLVRSSRRGDRWKRWTVLEMKCLRKALQYQKIFPEDTCEISILICGGPAWDDSSEERPVNLH